MVDKKTHIGGVVIDGLNIKKDLFYYKIPLSLVDKIKIGTRVEVPFGNKDDIHSGFIFSIEESEPSSTEDLKEIQSILGASIIDEETRDLIQFITSKYFIPIHIFFNKILKGAVSEIYRRYVVLIDSDRLKNSNFRGIKKQLADFIIKKELTPVSVIRKKFGKTAERYLKELENAGYIERKNIVEERSKAYYTLNVEKNKIDKIISNISDKNLKNSSLQIIARLIGSAHPVRETELKKGIRYGKKTIHYLLQKRVIRKVLQNNGEKVRGKGARFLLFSALPIEERTRKIINIIKGTNGKALIIFPEIALIQRVKSLYIKAFGKDVFTWNGHNKRKLVEAVYFSGTKVILSTFFPLFLKIPDLQYIVLEDASSKYFKQSDFVPFDVEIASIKKALLEDLHVIFSTPVPDEYLFSILNGKVNWKKESHKNKHVIKIIDMREEFKNNNRKMLSLYLQKRLKELLDKNSNIAILLNRKSYSTFVMCRECGYVVRCPNCNVPMHYDKEKRLMVCPVCGYTEKPLDVCPRCKSPSLRYFSGGIQKLEEQLKKEFGSIQIFKLIKESEIGNIVHSNLFKGVIFLGTEYMQSHLTLENVALYAFISIDIFLNHYSFNSSFNTFRIIVNTALEMDDREIIVQTYLPEHFALKSAVNLNVENFFKEEFAIREQLGYPPFKNLLIFTFSGTNKEEVFSFSNKFAEQIKKQQAQCYALGPSPSVREKIGNTYYFDVSIKVDSILPEFREIYLDFVNSTSKIKISVNSYLSIKEFLDGKSIFTVQK